MSDITKTKAVAWPARRLGDLFRINGDQVVPMASPKAEFVHYSIPAWDATGGPAIELGAQIESNKTAINSSAILVSKLNPRKPRVVAVPTPAERTCCSTEFICYQPKQSNEDFNFWAAYFTSADFSARLARVAVGSTNSHTRAAPKETLKWFVPEVPSVQQQKIAQILDTLDTAIHETEAIIAKLKAVKQGLLHDLLTRGIDANGELRPPQAEAPHLYKQSPLGCIPKEWGIDFIANLTTSSVIGPFGSDLVASDYRVSGVPVIFVRDVKPDFLIWKSDVYVSPRKAQALAAHEVIAGDIVATKMGLPPCVAAVYPDTMPNGIVTADIVRLRPNLSLIRPNWMSTFINSPAVAKQVEQITAGVTRPKVTLRDVRNLRLAVPLLEEQQFVLDRVVAMESRIRLEDAALQKLLVKKSGLMDDLLTGRVRVTPLLAEAE